MTNILALTKVLIKNNVFALSGRKKKGKTTSATSSAIWLIVLLVFCLVMIGAPVILTLNDLLKEYDFSEVIISFIVPIGGFTSIIFGVFSIISVFYFSKDSEQLLPLPIKSSELLISKFLASLVSEYLIIFMFILPILVGVGVGASMGPVYYLYMLATIILMPIIPSVIMSIILMLANKIFHFNKRKDLFMYIMFGLIIAFSFAYSFGIEGFLNSEVLINLFSGNLQQLIRISRYLFPFFNSAVYALTRYNEFVGFAAFMAFIGINLLALVILYFVGEKLYIKGLSRDSGSRQNKKKDLSKVYKYDKKGIVLELMSKEWRSIRRTPIFMLNVVVANFIFPIIFGISFFIGFIQSAQEIPDMEGLINFTNPSVMLIAIGALTFLCSIASSSSSAISREGSSAWVMKTIPVSLKKQLDAKVYFSLIIDFIIVMMFEAILIPFIKVPLTYLFLVNVPLILILLIYNYLVLILDLRRPRLDWKEESEAVKQNMNVFFSMILNMAIAGLFVLLGLLIDEANLNIYLVFVITSVLLLGTYIALMIFIKKKQVKLFSKVG